MPPLFPSAARPEQISLFPVLVRSSLDGARRRRRSNDTASRRSFWAITGLVMLVMLLFSGLLPAGLCSPFWQDIGRICWHSGDSGGVLEDGIEAG